MRQRDYLTINKIFRNAILRSKTYPREGGNAHSDYKSYYAI